MEVYVKSAKFENNTLLIENELGQLIKLDFSNVASAATLAQTVNSLKVVQENLVGALKIIDELNAKIETLEKKLQESDNQGVVHKMENELIPGTKSFRRLRISDLRSEGNPGITLGYVAGETEAITLSGTSGKASIVIEREPVEDMEIVNKKYVDDKVEEIRQEIFTSKKLKKK